jgi:hypothetical protein
MGNVRKNVDRFHFEEKQQQQIKPKETQNLIQCTII